MANSSLINENIPVYVTGLDRGVRPIGLWSISIILSMLSTPFIFLQWTKPSLLSNNVFTIDVYKTSLISEDLPEPETPVIHVNRPTGILIFISSKLLALASIMDIHCLLGFNLFSGTSILFLPVMKSDVCDDTFLRLFGFPENITSPPWTPALGPISTIWSEVIIVSSSCSTTITVLPKSLKFLRVSNNLSLSLWWRPIDGSSSTYNTPVKPDPIWLANLFAALHLQIVFLRFLKVWDILDLHY